METSPTPMDADDFDEAKLMVSVRDRAELEADCEQARKIRDRAYGVPLYSLAEEPDPVVRQWPPAQAVAAPCPRCGMKDGAHHAGCPATWIRPHGPGLKGSDPVDFVGMSSLRGYRTPPHDETASAPNVWPCPRSLASRVNTALVRWSEPTGDTPPPTALYLGRAESRELDAIIRDLPLTSEPPRDDRHPGGLFMGLRCYRIDAPTHLDVGRPA